MSMTHRFSLLLITMSCLMLPCSCAKNTKQTGVSIPSSKTYVFECLNKEKYTVRIEHNSAQVFLPMGFVALPHVPSVSGAKYSDGKSTVWRRGEQAILNLGGKPLGNCVNNPREAAWEQAKLEGVSFRAVGHNPQWLLEIRDHERVAFSTGDHHKWIEFPYVPPCSTGAGVAAATYQTKTADQTLTVSIAEQQCRDPESGQTFEAAVTVTLNGKDFRGCGKALN